MRKLRYILLVSSMLLLLAVRGASADTLFGNIWAPQTGDRLVTAGDSYCQGFDLGASSYDLNRVLFWLDESYATVTIWDGKGTDAGGSGHSAPGHLLGTLVEEDNPGGWWDYTFDPSTPIHLAANTTYYVVLSTTGPSYNAYYTYQPSPVGSGWWGEKSGGAWHMDGPAYPLVAQVFGDPAPDPPRVPEPGTMALLLMGLPVGLLWRKRRA